MDNDRFYHKGMRELQDVRATRQLADRMEGVIVHSQLTAEDRAFIEQCSMVIVATADDQGRPDCSYKGGLPGFVRVLDEGSICLPDYDGNGMYRSWGNVLVNSHVGLLFIDFELQKRMRINGTAVVSAEDPLLTEYSGAVFMVRITVEHIFPNCSRYIHKMQMVEHSVYVPCEHHQPPSPAWKKYDEFRDALPARDRDADQ